MNETHFLPNNPGTPAIVECPVSNAALGAVQVQKVTSPRFLVRVTSVRKRLLDEDNLAEKYHVDLCRYAGVLPKDAPGIAKIEACQQKAGKGQAEEVRIEIWEMTQ